MTPPRVRKQKLSQEKILQSKLESSFLLEALLEHTKSNDPDAERLRVKISEHLTDLILTDPRFACEHGIVERLWRLCFYDRIHELRGSRYKLKRRGEDYGKVQDALTKHVSKAIHVYSFMTKTLEDNLMEAYPALSGTQALQEDPNNHATSSPIASKSPGGIMKCLVPMLVQLGDLHRYSDQKSQAQAAYERASQLGPGIGHSMNQLGVLFSQDGPVGQRLVTLYWFARSLSVNAEPFNMHDNLIRFFESNQKWLLEPENRPRSSTLADAKLFQWEQFSAEFCHLHSSFFTAFLQEKLDCVSLYQQMKTCRKFLSELLQNAVIGESLLCKLVTVNAFSETLAERARATWLSDSDPIIQAIALTSRVFTLWSGTSLAEQVLAGHTDKGQQRLVPLMLVAEYVSSHPIPAGKSFPNKFGEPDLVALHTDAENEFWKTIVDVLNYIQAPSTLSGTESDTETAPLLEEYLELRGFLPFAALVPEISSCGRLSDEEAVRELSMLRKGKHKALNSGSTAEKTDQRRVKVLRFLALGQTWANDQDSFFAQHIHFDEGSNAYVFVNGATIPDAFLGLDGNGVEMNRYLASAPLVETVSSFKLLLKLEAAPIVPSAQMSRLVEETNRLSENRRLESQLDIVVKEAWTQTLTSKARLAVWGAVKKQESAIQDLITDDDTRGAEKSLQQMNKLQQIPPPLPQSSSIANDLFGFDAQSTPVPEVAREEVASPKSPILSEFPPDAVPDNPSGAGRSPLRQLDHNDPSVSPATAVNPPSAFVRCTQRHVQDAPLNRFSANDFARISNSSAEMH